jgi:hypothetical protein
MLTARIGPVAALQPLKLRDLARETTSKTPKLSLQTLSPPDSANTRLSSAACATVVSTEEQLCDSTATANVRQHCDSKCATALRQQLCDSNCATALRQQVCDSTATAIVRQHCDSNCATALQQQLCDSKCATALRQQLCDSTATAIVRQHCNSNCATALRQQLCDSIATAIATAFRQQLRQQLRQHCDSNTGMGQPSNFWKLLDSELSEKNSHRAPCWLALRSSLQHQCSCSMLADTEKQICRSCNTNAAEASWAGDATAARKLHSSRNTANHGSNARCI